MKYYKYLYNSESIKNVNRIKQKLLLHKGIADIFIIFISDDHKNLEIMSACFLKLKYYRKHPPIIVGITKTHEEATTIIVQMMDESLNKTGKPNIIDYLKLRAKTNDFTL